MQLTVPDDLFSGGFVPHEHQREAVLLAAKHRVMVLTGGPGTGKTTVVEYIIKLLELNGLQVLLAAPTGVAARRMVQQTGKPSKTLHSLLGWTGDGWRFNADAPVQFNEAGVQVSGPLACDALIVDEVSMVDAELMEAVLQALGPHQRLILVGDVDQLPSIGAGAVLQDIIESGAVPVARLTKIFRQASESLIPYLAAAINAGDVGDIADFKAKATQVDVAFKEMPDEAAVADLIVHAVVNHIPTAKGFLHDEIQVLCPQHGHAIGGEALNARLQAELNPNWSDDERDGLRIGRGARAFEGDRVMVTRNNRPLEVANGEQGKVLASDWRGVNLGDFACRHVASQVMLVVDFGDGRVLGFGKGELADIELAYAMTVHKSQGSQFPCVVMPVHSLNEFMLTRRLLYTAVTRAQRFMFVVGEEAALQGAATNTRGLKRATDLEALLGDRVVGEVTQP